MLLFRPVACPLAPEFGDPASQLLPDTAPRVLKRLFAASLVQQRRRHLAEIAKKAERRARALTDVERIMPRLRFFGR